MTLCLKVKKEKAESLKNRLKAKGFFDKNKKILKDPGFVYLPLKSPVTKKQVQKLGKVVSKRVPVQKKPHTLAEILKGKLSARELKTVKTSFDILGKIAIVEIPPELKAKEKLMGNALLKLHKNLRAVFKKAGHVKGKFRVRKLKRIAGKGSSETTYKESGCIFKFDAAKAYFSGRESTERERISSQVKKNEKILVMFAGIGSFPIVMAKKQPLLGKVHAVEINPDAFRYMEENIILNKMKAKIIPIQGDVNKVCPKLSEKFDRILMPLPKGAYKFLDTAIPLLKKKGTIHLYHWAWEPNLYTEAENLVKTKGRKFNKKTRILRKKKVLPYAPRVWKIVLDVEYSS